MKIGCITVAGVTERNDPALRCPLHALFPMIDAAPPPGDSSPTAPPPKVDYVALAPGHRVGRYEILAILGQGGFGITYRARDTQLDREVALKEYLPAALAVRQDGASVLPRSTEVAEDFGWGRARFIEEGRTLATLHEAPSIVQVFDFLEENGTAYIVMELLRGETLEERIKAEGPLSPAELDAILWPLLEGLRQVHEIGFLHRDIKPANVLLGEGNRPTLIDFGASRAAMADRTQVMTAIFTPGYAAPEQFTSARQGPWTDIYGLAATLYHAITGKAPPNAFDRLMEDACEPLGSLQPTGFTRGLLSGLDGGLSVHAEERPQSIAAWRMLLEEAAADGETTVVMAAPPTPPPTPPTLPTPPTPPTPPTALAIGPRTGGHGKWIALAVAVILLVAGGVYYAMAPRSAAVTATAPPAPVSTPAETTDAAAAPPAAPAIQATTPVQPPPEAAPPSAEAEEAALHLGTVERQRLQMALTALGFDTRGSDGAFGPRSREMITAWQQARSRPATGYLTAAESQALLREAQPALLRLDEEKRRAPRVVPSVPVARQPASPSLPGSRTDFP
jgi:serine/threonine protein kinase